MLFGTGLAFFLRQALHPAERRRTCPRFASALVRHHPQLRAALQINVLFIVGMLLAVGMLVGPSATRAGASILRSVGESADAARAMGYSTSTRMRFLATMVGGVLAGVGGSFLSLYYPGSWNEGLSSGPGSDGGRARDLRALEPAALPVAPSLLFGGAGALGPALQSVGITPGLLPLQRRALRADPFHHDRDSVGQAPLGGSRRPSCSITQMTEGTHCPSHVELPTPIPGPSTATLRPRQHRADHHRHADRLLRRRRLRRRDGLRPLAHARARSSRSSGCSPRCARKGYHDHPHARGPPARPVRPARQQALALAAHRRGHRRCRAVRAHPGARRARLGHHPRARAAGGRADHRQAGQGLVLRDRPRPAAAHARHRATSCSPASRPTCACTRRCARPTTAATSACCSKTAAAPPTTATTTAHQDGQDAGRRVRRGLDASAAFIEAIA